MKAIDVIRRLHEHRRWANHRLLDAAFNLSPAELRQQFPIGQGSVWQSLLHLCAAEYVWLEALLGNDDPLLPGDLPGKLPGNQEGASPLKTLEELAAVWAELDGRWQRYLGELSVGDLAGLVRKKSTSSGEGRVFQTPTADVLLHVCTHAQYTTAQVVNMLRQLGAGALPDTMLITLSRHLAG